MNYNESVQQLLKTDGALAAAVVDFSSGMLLAGGGSTNIDLEIAAAGNTEVLRAKMKTMQLLDLKETIDDILITLGEQYHLLRPVKKQDGLCLYFVLDKSKSNLALARRALVEVEKVIKELLSNLVYGIQAAFSVDCSSSCLPSLKMTLLTTKVNKLNP